MVMLHKVSEFFLILDNTKTSLYSERVKFFKPTWFKLLVFAALLPFFYSRSDALLTVLKKWTFDLSMTKVALRRQIFEANVNWFTLILQVHGTKPLDDPVQQASVRLG